MDIQHYTVERNAQIILRMLKEYNIRKVVASPGTTNVTMVASMQNDPYFEMYSCVDERSAAYLACGLAEESGEAVVLSCTGATASRNYMPGLTEAYYRKLPVIAITATQTVKRIGHLVPQVIDRSSVPNDICRGSWLMETIHNGDEEKDCIIKINRAMIALTADGGGPVHLNMETTYCPDFSQQELPQARVIRRFSIDDRFPPLPDGRIAIFVGSHRKWTDAETEAIDRFCGQYDSAVFCDHTSNYKGRFRILSALIGSQPRHYHISDVDLLIHIGEVSGDYPGSGLLRAREVWRVSPDGELKDTFGKLTAVFKMKESQFFQHYAKPGHDKEQTSYIDECRSIFDRLQSAVPEDIPFSNIWIAKTLSRMLPESSVLHLGILNTIRSWNFFEIPSSVLSYSNVGGFGIDGDMSTLIGASLAYPDKLYFGILGDLAFFYDMNVLGNRHIRNNVRLMLINNGRGVEFRNYNHFGAMFGEAADKYIAAAGHFGNKSASLVRHYAEDLGFEYLCAKDKVSFAEAAKTFTDPRLSAKPILFEVFTDTDSESSALKIINNLEHPKGNGLKGTMKKVLDSTFGEGTASKLKSMLK